jgi:hypothetical protein
MEILSLLDVLWRRRLLVAVGLVAALALGFLAGGGTPTSFGRAHTRVLLDTTKSQVVENAPYGAETLPWRANLIVHLAGTDAAKRRLADQVAIPVDQLAVVDTALSVPDVRASMPKAAAEAAAVTGAPYVLTVSLNEQALPIIAIETHAPDRRKAARLAEAAAALLKDAAPPPGAVPDVSYEIAESMAAVGDPRALQGFVVEDFGPVRSKAVEENPAPLKAGAVFLVVFGLWCAGVALGPARSPRGRSLGGGGNRTRKTHALEAP